MKASHVLAGTARFFVPALLAVLTACTSGEARDAGPASDLDAAWTVAETPTLRIGASEADALGFVTSAVGLPGGGVALADAGMHRIDVFDARGRRVRTIGREGRGPGEFTHPAWIGLRGDTLRVWDMVQARLTLFDTAGQVIRTEPPLTDLGSFPRVAGQFADGSLLLMGGSTKAWRTGPFRDSMLLVRVHPGGRRDTLGRVPGNEQIGSVERNGTVSKTDQLPFGRRTLVAVRGERVYLGTGDSSTIVSSADGRAWARAAAVPGPRRRVTPQDIDDYWKRLLVQGSTRGSPDKRPEGIEYPEKYPPYADVQPAPNGDLWVLLTPRPSEWDVGSRWIVFSPDGAVRGTVYIPGRARILEIGDGWALLSESDADDQQVVARYPLAAPSS